MLNRVWRCCTRTLYMIVSQLAPPLPHRVWADGRARGRTGRQATHKDGGAGVERCAHVTVYIYFSLCLSRFRNASPLLIPLVILSASLFSPVRAEVMSKEGVRPFGK